MISRKVILTGSFGVGKTSLFNRFINNTFSEKYLTTIGVKVDKKVVAIDGEQVAILLWDIAGEVNQRKVPKSYFLGASAIIYVFDLTRPLTWENISDDLAFLQSILPNVSLSLIGNKKDLLTAAEIQDVLRKIKPSVDFCTSAKTGENVEELFQEIAKGMVA